MPMIDPFTPDAFSLQSLTAAINKTIYRPGRISEMGIFEEQGITTLDAAIEEQDGVLTLLPVQPRGSNGSPVGAGKRHIRSFRVPHIPEVASIKADEVQGVRAFGSDSNAEVLQTRINERLQTMRNNIDYTIEAHRLSAVKGLFYDANNTQTDLFAEFGVTQQVVAMALATATTNVRDKVLTVLEAIETELDGVPFSGVHVLCGHAFWAAFTDHAKVRDTYLNTQQAAALRGDPRDVFQFGGITWERYRGNSVVNILTDEAYAIPLGVSGLFLTRFAPADYNETVNTLGLPYYSKAEPMKMGKGWDIEAQSNPLNICTRPSSVIKLTRV